jgi:hypothetical protein
MVSIIICSIKEDFLNSVSENISQTIGIDYELLVWDNRLENKGICAVYNIMAARAKYEYLCFVHEDVLFETQDWGTVLQRIFESQPAVGAIGVAGAKYKSTYYSGWWTGQKDLDVFHINHRINGVDYPMFHPKETGFHRVVCIDGVFIACRKSLWKKSPFDEESLKGFHYYDLDFSLRVARISEVVVTLDIYMTHITQGGDYGDKWVVETMKFHLSHQRLLPFGRYSTGRPDVDLSIAAKWLDRLRSEKISAENKRAWIKSQGLNKHMSQLWYPLLKFWLYRPLKLHIVHNLLKKLK